MDDSWAMHQVIKKLDDYVIGQADAKRAVAIALRNRWRRHLLPESFKNEVGSEHAASAVSPAKSLDPIQRVIPGKGYPEEHPDDRAYGLRQDGDSAPDLEDCAGALHQGSRDHFLRFLLLEGTLELSFVCSACTVRRSLPGFYPFRWRRPSAPRWAVRSRYGAHRACPALTHSGGGDQVHRGGQCVHGTALTVRARL